MERQTSAIKFEGTIGDIVFYKTGHGHLARAKGEITAKRVRTDPAFERTRETNAEFSRQGKAVKLLRAAFRTSFQHASDSNMTGRMTREVVKIIRLDTNAAGQRKVLYQNLGLLDGFDFNINATLRKVLSAPYTFSINKADGELAIHFPSFVPNQCIEFPVGATHCKIVSAVAEIDFEKNILGRIEEQTSEIANDSNVTSVIDVRHHITPNGKLPLFVAVGIRFFQNVNDNAYPLHCDGHNCLAIAKIF